MEIRQVDADVIVNSVGDLVLVVGGQEVAGILYDHDSPTDPTLVIWSEGGDPVFTVPLFDLNAAIKTVDETEVDHLTDAGYLPE